MSAQLKIVEASPYERLLPRRAVCKIWIELQLKDPPAFYTAPPRDYDRLVDSCIATFGKLPRDKQEQVFAFAQQAAARAS